MIDAQNNLIQIIKVETLETIFNNLQKPDTHLSRKAYAKTFPNFGNLQGLRNN